MINLGIIFGSRAAEHDVSIISALQLIENTDKSKYNVFPIYISRGGEWFIGEPLRKMDTYKNFDPLMKGLTKVILPPVPSMNGLYTLGGSGLFSKTQKVADLDCAILALHGMHGEDGTVQGLMELADIPYSSCGMIGSAVGMDKITMKMVFKSMELPTIDGTYCYRSEWRASQNEIIERAEKIGYPLFVKPNNLGSSIGISRATDRESLIKAMDVACEYDRRIIIEKGVSHPIEVNCACLGFDGETTVSLCEQPTTWDEFLTFDEKYIVGAKGKGMSSHARKIPAPISDDLTQKIQSYTREIFRMLECKGVVRIDYLLDSETNDLYVCEINTIPGSFAFYLFEPMGLQYRQLVDKLVEYAYKALAQKNESTFAYDSMILEKALKGGKLTKK